MHSTYMPSIIQSVGLACVPVPDLSPASALARKPIAAAVVTVRCLPDGRREAGVRCLSDARDLEFPLPYLLDGAVAPGVPTVITPGDRALLGIEATSRRFFVEPQLAALVAGDNAVDPVGMFGVGEDEGVLCRRLMIPTCQVPDRDVELGWRRNAPQATEGIALASAVSRLMLWAHRAAFQAAVPDPFFEVLGPLAERLHGLERAYPILIPMLSSRPFNRVASFKTYYRDYRAARDAGDADARWVTFENDLLHV